MSNSIQCHYCFGIIDCDDFLSCEKCGGNVHTKCLKRPGTPGDILGDVFFIFTCSVCTSDGREIFLRQKLPWLMIVAIAIYNLSIQSKGLSSQGYFHWRIHITNFIDRNWDFLFPASVRRRKKWIGTVSGVLSHNSPEFFTSGHDVVKDAGWWKLTYNQTPKFYMKLYEQLSITRQQLRNDKRKCEEIDYSNIIIDEKRRRFEPQKKEEQEENILCSRMLPYMGRPPPSKKCIKEEEIDLEDIQQNSVTEMSSVESNLKEFLEQNLDQNDLIFNDIPEVINETDKVLSLINSNDNDNSIYDLWSSDLPNLEYEDGLFNGSILTDNKITSTNLNQQSQSQQEEEEEEVKNEEEIKQENESDENDCDVRVIQVTNFQQKIKEETNNDDNDKRTSKNVVNKGQDDEFFCGKSLFTKNPKRELPWLEEEKQEKEELEKIEGNNDENADDDSSNKDVQMMSANEEKLLYYQLKNIFENENQYNIEIPPSIRRFYRKLHIRDYKRKNFLPLFNLDTFGKKPPNKNSHILDRYYEFGANFSGNNIRITGPVQYEFFESPYTSRILHPFIYRHSKLFPPWLKTMCELQYVVNGDLPTRSTIDFCYIRPNHVPAINSLLQCLFWPGIDISETLSYPDFTVVALYKKLVIGCAFLVPDVGYNEAYISFMAVRPGWQRSGIASFMLYHLTQTCMGKDITLHVSATNSAVCLYQKFGFKIKEVILDFYEKYLPIESKHSRHALFLRLQR